MSALTQNILKTGLPHRPWAYPEFPWSVRQDWLHLSFLHWETDPGLLQALLPEPLKLDTYEGKAYIGLVPFLMDNVRPRFLPCVPGVSRFPELNIRTYVTLGEKPGVFFFSLDADSWTAVWIGKKAFHLPYFSAEIRFETDDSGVRFESQRRGLSLGEEAFSGTFSGSGDIYYAEKGSLEYFLTERYCFYAEIRGVGVVRSDVAHKPWPIRKGLAQIEVNSMVGRYGVEANRTPDLVHSTPGVQVLGWWPQSV